MPASRSRSLPVLAAAFLAAAPFVVRGARAEDMPTFRIEMRDGAIVPDRLEVPANTRIKIEIANTGATPVEFESLELKREKVVAAGDTGSLVIRRLDPGTYEFFDDFHPGTKATLVAR